MFTKQNSAYNLKRLPPSMTCIRCNSGVKLAKDAAIKQAFQGDSFFVRSPAYVCTQCGQQYLVGTQGDRLRRKTIEEYRRRHNLLSSSQIDHCRKGLSLSLEEFARQLQIPAKQVRRWKTWLVQDKSIDQRIRRLFGPFNLESDRYERFLTGHMSARRLCAEIGFAEDANQLVHVFWGLQAAYDRLAQHKANNVLLQAVRGFRSGKVTAREVEGFLGLNANALVELFPAQPLETEWSAERLSALKLAEGGAWSAAELQRKFGFAAGDLCYRRVGRKIVFWKDAKGMFRYPRWQFTKTGALLPGIAESLRMLQSDDVWRIMRYFLGKRRQLGNRRPLDLLRKGLIKKVIAHAQVQAAENTW